MLKKHCAFTQINSMGIGRNRYHQILERLSAFLMDEHYLLTQHPMDAYERAKEIEDFVEDDIIESNLIIQRISTELLIEDVYSLYARIIKRYENWTVNNLSGISTLVSYSKYADYLGRSITELGLCSQLLGRFPKTIIIVGSGALPVSAVILANLLPNAYFGLLDVDPEANQKAQEFIRRFPFANRCSIIEEDAIGYNNYLFYDLILVASSVGVSTKSKRDLILQISNCQNEQAVTVIRQPFQLEELFLAKFDIPKNKILKEAQAFVVQGNSDMFQRNAYIFSNKDVMAPYTLDRAEGLCQN